MKTYGAYSKNGTVDCILDPKWEKMFIDGGIRIYATKTGYASVGHSGRKIGRTKFFTEQIHRIILDLPRSSNMVGDHINGNKMDNREINLRSVTQSINHLNPSNIIDRRNKSGARGVCFDKSKNSWMSYLKINKKIVYFKRFKNKEDAVLISNFHKSIRDL